MNTLDPRRAELLERLRETETQLLDDALSLSKADVQNYYRQLAGNVSEAIALLRSPASPPQAENVAEVIANMRSEMADHERARYTWGRTDIFAMNAGVFKRFFDTVTAALSAPSAPSPASPASPASPPTKPECMTQSEFDEAVGSAAHAASPPEPPASPPPAPVTPDWVVSRNLITNTLGQLEDYRKRLGNDDHDFIGHVMDVISRLAASNAPAAAPDERVERLREALKDAYRENQNMHCSTTISPKIGWDALERQTAILKAALAESRK